MVVFIGFLESGLSQRPLTEERDDSSSNSSSKYLLTKVSTTLEIVAESKKKFLSTYKRLHEIFSKLSI